MATLKFRLAKESTLTVDIQSDDEATSQSLHRLIAQLIVVETALEMHDRQQSAEARPDPKQAA